jgi:hypothetical protein
LARAIRDASRARLRASPPSARPSEIRVAVARIVGEIEFCLFKCGDELRFRNIQERARQQQAIALGLASHRRKTGDAAAAQQAHQHRLGLIVTGMRGEDMGGAVLPRRLRQQAVSREPGCRRQSGVRLGAGPAQRAVRQIERARQTLDVARLPRGLGTQAMIDSDGDQARTAPQTAAPACRQPHQRDRIRTAGHREHDRRGALPVREQAFGLLYRDRGMVVVGHD